jgi:hypothetical protein
MITLPTVSQVVYKPIHLDVRVKCSLRTFSADTMEFSAVMQIIYPKSPFSLNKTRKDFFRSYNGFRDFFRRYGGIFYGQNGHFGRFVLILFYSCGGNPTSCDFHRNCRKTLLSIVIIEKYGGKGNSEDFFIGSVR